MNGERLPVVQYVRMSTDHQRYSSLNQQVAIEAYADSHGMEIVGTYEDQGKSGLHLTSRKALKQLLDIVQSGQAYFRAILVYDVSRWGRFQNPDESAHYEYLCTAAGIKVIFCAEVFENDGSPLATIVKSVKRTMAAEFSRDLSTKVFIGQCRLARMGFRQGGPPGYGFKRVLLDEKGRYKGDLAFGERKNLQSDRVVLAPGAPEEVAVIRRIYHDFIEKKMSELGIATALNREGLLFAPGRPWTQSTIHNVLMGEKYVGCNVYSKTSSKLTRKYTRNSSSLWIRCEKAFDPIISDEVFEKAQLRLRERSLRISSETMLEKLRVLHAKYGYLNSKLIRSHKDVPTCYLYRKRFGDLVSAYALAGLDASGLDYKKIEKTIRELYAPLLSKLEMLVVSRGGSAKIDLQRQLLLVNDVWTVRIEILRSRSVRGRAEWHRGAWPSFDTDLILLARMDFQNTDFLDYYIIPSIEVASLPERMRQKSRRAIDVYRFPSLEVFGDLVGPALPPMPD